MSAIPKQSVCITGLMVRNAGERIVVEVEINHQWVEVINELVGPMEFAISHIVEPIRIIKAAGNRRVGRACKNLIGMLL